MLHDVVQRKKFYTLVLQKCLTRSYDVIVKEPNLYTQILKVSESIQDIAKLAADDPLRHYFKTYDVSDDNIF